MIAGDRLCVARLGPDDSRFRGRGRSRAETARRRRETDSASLSLSGCDDDDDEGDCEEKIPGFASRSGASAAL